MEASPSLHVGSRATVEERTETSALEGRSGFLAANGDAYEWLAKRLQAPSRQGDADGVLQAVASAARFAVMFHPGRFADGAIENVAFAIGTELGECVSDGGLPLPALRSEGRRRVLHVASHVNTLGGHTRMLHHWVRHDQSSCHSVAVTNQQGGPIPHWLADAVRDNGGNVTAFPDAWRIRQKAAWLREGAKRAADVVVLHHDPFDVVPIVAFARCEGPPVALVNHADHLFWLGGSVSDVVISLRTAGAEHASSRRFVASNVVLPVPLSEPARRITRRHARCVLGIPEDQVVLLSVGRAEKYWPCGAHDFVATAGRILERAPRAHLYVVGESLAGITPRLRCAVHERLHFVGSVEDPSTYRAAADVYLESFPFGSQTALLEAALSALPVVRAYAPLFPLLVANDDAVQEQVKNPGSEEEYIDRVDELVRSADRRLELGDRLRACLLAEHIGEGWQARLAQVYRQTDHGTHQPQAIPVSSSRTTAADVGLSMWHVVGDGKTYSPPSSDDDRHALLCHSAFVAKEVGNYAGARRLAWCAVRQHPSRRAPWRLLALTVLGPVARHIRKIIR
ncbi:MAG: glycosyltransferase [Luteitalea sp.]|nr:glycosyltransferase [Luteitalea sp.]